MDDGEIISEDVADGAAAAKEQLEEAQMEESETLAEKIQEAVDEQKGNPVQFFLTAKLPRYLARHAADGAYGKSKLGPQ